MAGETTRPSYNGLMHAGAGTGLALVQLSALIPGLLPTLGLLGVFTAVVMLPLVALWPWLMLAAVLVVVGLVVVDGTAGTIVLACGFIALSVRASG